MIGTKLMSAKDEQMFKTKAAKSCTKQAGSCKHRIK